MSQIPIHPAVAAFELWLGSERLADPETARLVGALRKATATNAEEPK